MGIGTTDEDYKALIARIAIGERKKLKGTGVLYIKNWGEIVLVFTVAHVLYDSFEKDKNNVIFIDFYDKNGNNHLINAAFEKISVGEKLEPYKVYWPENYNHFEKEYDMAFISIPWEEWMKSLPIYELRKPLTNTEVYGWGYPLSMIAEKHLEEGCADIKGTVVHSGKNRYSLTYQAPTREPQVSRDNEMPGYSGTALFENENGNRYFTGCLSCEAGDRTAGSRVWVTSYSLFWDEISKFDMSPSIPDSFLPYKEFTLQQVDKFSKEIREALHDMIDELIEDKKLVTADCIKGNSVESNELLCNEDRNRCSKYWKGQLTKAVCFCGVLDKNPEELAVLEFQKENDKIRVEFLCTEEEIEKSFRLLLKSPLTKSIRDEKGIIFLWNDEESSYYSRIIKRKNIRNIMTSIADTTRKRKKLSENSYWFNITDQGTEESNVAVIGMGALFNEVIFDSDGTIQEMKNNFSKLIKKAWEVF